MDGRMSSPVSVRIALSYCPCVSRNTRVVAGGLPATHACAPVVPPPPGATPPVPLSMMPGSLGLGPGVPAVPDGAIPPMLPVHAAGNATRPTSTKRRFFMGVPPYKELADAEDE